MAFPPSLFILGGRGYKQANAYATNSRSAFILVVSILIVQLAKISLVNFFLVLLVSAKLRKEGTLLFTGLIPCNFFRLRLMKWKTRCLLSIYKKNSIFFLSLGEWWIWAFPFWCLGFIRLKDRLLFYYCLLSLYVWIN